MTYFFVGGVVLLAGFAAFQYLKGLPRATFRRMLRWVVGGFSALVAIGMLLIRRFDIAMFVGAAAISILRTGRLGPISLDGPELDKGNVSKVKSYRFVMELDHDTGAVTGQVLNGNFAGYDLMDIGEMEMRQLLVEVENDADSLSLLESWLDVNRVGWREYFAQDTHSDDMPNNSAGHDPVAEAYEILGLKPGATGAQIRAAHRELMKGVHPDHGGSSYLASKINAARDLLLKA